MRGPGRAPRPRVRRLARVVGLLLLLAFAAGFAVGLLLRARLERRPAYLGLRPEPLPVQTTSGWPARAFSTRAMVKSASESRFR